MLMQAHILATKNSGTGTAFGNSSHEQHLNPMRAIVISQPGGPGQLTLAELPNPQPGPGQVLIRVLAAGLNHADLLQRAGHYPPPLGASPLPGLEVSGSIAAVGPDDEDGWKVGDHVCALLPGGGYAEYALASGGSCLPTPENLPISDAAALPEAVFTVWANLFATVPGQTAAAHVQQGERLLVQGGGSGIGTMAIQIAAARGIHVAATAGSEARCARCRELGAELAVDHHGDWAGSIRDWAAPTGVDAILDMIAGPYFAHHLELLGEGGRLAHIATAKGNEVTLDLHRMMQKRLVVTGSTLRRRRPEQKRALRDEIARELWPLFSQGLLQPVISARFPLAEAEEAHRAMERGGHFGKLLLLV